MLSERGGELRVLQPLLTKGGGSRTSLAAIWAAVDNNNQTKINRKLNAVVCILFNLKTGALKLLSPFFCFN